MSDQHKVLELSLDEPMKLAFLVKEMTELLLNAAKTSAYISKETKETDTEISKLANLMSSSIKLQIISLMEVVCKETDAEDPEVQAAISEAQKTGESVAMVVAKKKPADIIRPSFSVNVPGSQANN